VPAGLPLTGNTRAERMHIGVILPLTGNMARYGERALEGILLAAGTFQNSREYDFRLFIEDSQSNPEIARRAVDNLYNRDNVLAILGPLSWNEAVAVADRSQQLGILNLSLTGKEGVSSRGAYLFQNALTPRVQLESLVAHCMKEKSFKRFAILAPNNSFGKDMANEFWELVEKNGGHIVGYRLYPPDEKDFQEYVQHLVGLSNPKFRSVEVTRLAEFKKEAKEKTGREPKADIPPIVDFDAIFLPDSPATVSQIAASLAYYDVSDVALLGTTEWNSDQLYKRGGRYVEGALFPGGLSSSTKNEAQKNFIKQFAAAYGGAPDLLATQAFEAMHILTGALKETSSSDRNDIVREMSRMDGYQTPLGSITFDGTRIARRKLSVFKIEMGGNIVEQ
jgi:branched-chain amino acid transport system substrate-binding protein